MREGSLDFYPEGERSGGKNLNPRMMGGPVRKFALATEEEGWRGGDPTCLRKERFLTCSFLTHVRVGVCVCVFQLRGL